MSRRPARRTVIAAMGILLLILVGLARQNLGGNDTSFQVIAAEGEAQEGSGDSGVSRQGSTVVGEEAARSGRTGFGAAGSGGSGVQATGGASGDFASSDGDEFDDAAYSSSGADAGGAASIPLPPIPDSERIIKDGRIEVEVPKGSFDQAFRSVVSLAQKAGGDVASSQSSRDDKRASGEITIRVPSQRFDQLLESTNGLGKIEHREVSSQDVSGEFVDLQARVRHLQAQEQFYLGLLGKARVVGDAIAINQHLSTVQAEMERVQGRLRLIEEQTTYSRLTIALYEPGLSPLLTDRMVEQPGALGVAWREAVLAFQETIGALLVGAFTMAPLLALALAAWLLWRRLRPRPAAQDPRPVAEEEKGPLPVG